MLFPPATFRERVHAFLPCLSLVVASLLILCIDGDSRAFRSSVKYVLNSTRNRVVTLLCCHSRPRIALRTRDRFVPSTSLLCDVTQRVALREFAELNYYEIDHRRVTSARKCNRNNLRIFWYSLLRGVLRF